MKTFTLLKNLNLLKQEDSTEVIQPSDLLLSVSKTPKSFSNFRSSKKVANLQGGILTVTKQFIPPKFFEPQPVITFSPSQKKIESVFSIDTPTGNSGRLDFSQLAIAVVTCNRSTVYKTLRSILNSVSIFRKLYVIGNHPADVLVQEFIEKQKDSRINFIPTGRIPEHEGRLSESWNLAIQWAFRDSGVNWLWCMHDDVEILPGWPQLVESYPADLYLAPFGDMCFLFNRDAFNKVGWFDERFVCRGYQDNDWQIRAIIKLGSSRVVLENKIPELCWLYVNPLGLSNFWRQTQPFVLRHSDSIGLSWFQSKWGILPTNYNWHDIVKYEKSSLEELNWYPEFKGGTYAQL